jgi:DNA-binding transcriptional LysR family regulator
LPPCLNRFAKSHPAIKVQVEYRRSKQVYEEVLDGVADLGVVAYPTRMPKLEAVNLKEDRLVLICHPRHPFAKLKTVKLKMLNGQRFLNLSPELPTGKALHKLIRINRLTVEAVNDFDSIDALKRAVEIDSGIGIVPQTTVVQEVANTTLSSVSLEGDPARPLAVVYRKSKVLSPGMRQFVLLLKESL